MFRRIVFFVCFGVLSSLLVPKVARAAEAPAADVTVEMPDLAPPTVHVDMRKLRISRTRWGVGLTLGLVGVGMTGAGLYGIEMANRHAVAPDVGALVAAMGMGIVVGGGLIVSTVGMSLAIAGSLSNAVILRRAGLDVSTGLAVAALVTPLTCIALGFGLNALGVAYALPILSAGGYAASFALSGAQLVVGGQKLRASRTGAPALTVVPARVSKSPGIRLSVAW